MNYIATLASVSAEAIDRYRTGAATADLPVSRIEECPHDLIEMEIQPLGRVLAEAIDIGQPLRNEGWHPLRAPVVADPETVMARAMKLEDAWQKAEPQLGGMMAEALSPSINRVRALYAHAAAKNEAVLSFLSAPDDESKAARSLIPTVHVSV
jgi:hypothetical protein